MSAPQRSESWLGLAGLLLLAVGIVAIVWLVFRLW
jgi:hypothetical protein